MCLKFAFLSFAKKCKLELQKKWQIRIAFNNDQPRKMLITQLVKWLEHLTLKLKTLKLVFTVFLLDLIIIGTLKKNWKPFDKKTSQSILCCLIVGTACLSVVFAVKIYVMNIIKMFFLIWSKNSTTSISITRLTRVSALANSNKYFSPLHRIIK